MNDALQQLLDRLTALLAEKPLIGAWYTTVHNRCALRVPAAGADDPCRCDPLAVEGQAPG